MLKRSGAICLMGASLRVAVAEEDTKSVADCCCGLLLLWVVQN